jgi:hypothetical protein
LKNERSLSELRRPKQPFLLAHSKHPGKYRELETGKFWNDNDIKVYESKNPWDSVFLFFQTDEIGSNLENTLTKMVKRGMNK